MTNRSVPRRVSLLVVAAALVLGLSGCAQSSDPTSWEQADEEGKVEENFLVSCVEADQGETADAKALDGYCGCVYAGVREAFADDFSAFTDVDAELRKQPDSINEPSLVKDADVRASVVTASEVAAGCKAEFLT
ncbi:MAG: hypothetical protein R2695_04975 [Acidimicrobiales bacterium]